MVLLFASLSMAKSRVGEWAAYDYQEDTATTSIKGILLKEVLEETRMRDSNGKMQAHLKVSETLSVAGVPVQETIKWESVSQYRSNFDLSVYVFACCFMKDIGTKEKIKVKAGKFDACREKDKDSWVGVVPFNHLLFIQTEETVFRRYELIKYSWKKK